MGYCIKGVDFCCAEKDCFVYNVLALLPWCNSFCFGRGVSCVFKKIMVYLYRSFKGVKNMKKIILSVILVITAFMCFTFSASAEKDGYYTYSVSDGKATITDVSSSISGAVNVPATLGGYKVTSIGYSAFEGCTNITSIRIPDSVTEIGSSAFEDCTSLMDVTIGKGVTLIDYYAFAGCTGLTSITVPENVTSIGGRVFYGCSNLKSITLPFVGASLNDTEDTSFGHIFYGNLYVPKSLKEVIITAPCKKNR